MHDNDHKGFVPTQFKIILMGGNNQLYSRRTISALFGPMSDFIDYYFSYYLNISDILFSACSRYSRTNDAVRHFTHVTCNKIRQAMFSSDSHNVIELTCC